ncbi:MAG: hypothetical protein FWF72_06895 [Paludibacter sp.]|nr:hypothetical protein [Paludibacter sp.]
MKISIINLSKLLLLAAVLSLFSCNNRQKMIEKTAEEINAKCPMDISMTVRLDKIEALPNTFKYYYTIKMLDLTGIEFDEESLSQTGKKLAIRALQDLPYFSQIKKLKANIIYAYFDSKHNHIYDVKITEADYNINLPPATDEEIAEGMAQNLKLEIKSIVRQLPLNVMDGVVLKQCDYLENEKTIFYVFQLGGIAEKTALSNRNSFCEQNEISVKANLKKDLNAVNYLKYGFTYSYKYIDSQDNVLCEFAVNKDSE